MVALLPSISGAQLRESANGHYLYELQNGEPVFLNGESAWCLFTATTYTQADSFFQNCRQYGINFLQTMLLDDGFTLNSPANRNGDPPFTGANFITPRESYFTHADSIIGLAKQYGIYLHLYISYLGSNPSEGWLTEIAASSVANMKTWGTFVGARYKDSTNIVWGISGDIDPTPVQQKLDSMSIALLAQDTNHLLVPRDEPYTQTQTHWSGRSWLKIEYIYPYWGPQNFDPERIYQMGWDIYNSARPGFLEEAWYENEHIDPNPFPTDAQLQQQMYYGSPISGTMGQTFGNGTVWGFDLASRSWLGPGLYRDWLDSQGHISTGWVGKLFNNRKWWTFVPDQSGTVLTAGANTGPDRAICAYASDSTTIMVYMPSSRQVTVTSASLKGDSTHAWWFNPTNGNTIDLSIQTRASHNYTPTSGDWVLVLDAKVMNYPAPGVDLTVTPPPPPVLNTPANGATGVATNPTLTWNPSTGAVTYRIQVSQDSSWVSHVIDQSGITTTFYHASALANNTRYFWHVNAANGGGISPFSDDWDFTTTIPAPSLVFPSDGEIDLPVVLALRWNQSDGGTGYRFQLSRDSLFSSTVVDDSTLADTLKEVGPLEHFTLYFWRVMAKGPSGSSAWSAARQFSTIPSLPQAPALLAPSDGSTNQQTTLLLVWRPSYSASMYRLQLSSDSLFVAIVLDDSTLSDTTCLAFFLSASSTYCWRVRAANTAGGGPWSERWSFSTALEATQRFLIARRWNLISLPVTPIDARKTFLFPTATSDAFAFRRGIGYVQSDTLWTRVGYWLKFDSAQVVNITGIPHVQDTIDVGTGWNLIGSVYGSVDTSAILTLPPGIQLSRFFEYASGYRIASTIDGGKGYWVKSSSTGKLVLSPQMRSKTGSTLPGFSTPSRSRSAPRKIY